MSTAPDPPACIQWPVRVLAVIVVLPFRLAWELLTAVGRFLERYVGGPLAWLWQRLVVVPLTFLWHWLVVVPATWLWRWAVVVPATWLWRWAVVVPLSWLAHWLLVVPLRWLWARRQYAVRP